jgi:hypothetical protein
MTALFSRRYLASAISCILLLAFGSASRARAAMVYGETVYRTTTYTLIGCGPFARTGGPTILNKGLGVWQAACTYNVAVSDEVVRDCYNGWWDRFWAENGTKKTITVRPGPGNGTTVTRTETFFCFTNEPPVVPSFECDLSVPFFAYSPDAQPSAQPLAAFSTAAQNMTLPSFAANASYQTVLAGFGQAQLAGAQAFGDLASQISTLDDPYGLNATFQSAYAAVGTNMTAVGNALQSGIPTTSAPFSTLATSLRNLAADFGSLPDPSSYSFAMMHLGYGALAMDRAAGLIDAGLTSGPDADVAQLSFLQNLDTLRVEYQNSPAGVCVPEPSTVILCTCGCAGLLMRSRSRGRRNAKQGP